MGSPVVRSFGFKGVFSDRLQFQSAVGRAKYSERGGEGNVVQEWPHAEGAETSPEVAKWCSCCCEDEAVLGLEEMAKLLRERVAEGAKSAADTGVEGAQFSSLDLFEGVLRASSDPTVKEEGDEKSELPVGA